ncbi:hypothetical protein TVAG_015510 [Trichomonas vaginalis G3]|uniref:Leucine Rich Repeat family protein n=1 Tax=Trichomonas vaginalis (strain ATCC PRA-98 / G3) TaxID=412133 RepID=A2F6V1_TRIV3|nr:ribonuclease inhibitor domain-containing protein [Trichomonas vaginalis G3]EAX99368.1 hypothetical protein TVAG_015510 [Trichomonas vaginalis G3]KAI5511318.1 ribonuclease inhibitor domain-containing protein [Trichomonas vaginalis G3]|eukprot:XP_001312298.1 hypothetical protein [Trichomonas vaginalis G3]
MLFLRSFLPENHILAGQIEKLSNISKYTPEIYQPLYILISCCLSLECRPSEKLMLSFKNQLHHGQRLKITHVPSNTKVTDALCRCLQLMRTVDELVIGGYNFFSLYSKLPSILKENSKIKSLTIIEYSKSDDFSEFLKSIPKDGLERLKFKDVIFQDSMISGFEGIKLRYKFSELVFSGCTFTEEQFTRLIGLSDSISQLSLFSLSHLKLDFEISKDMINKIVKLLSNSGIYSLKLKDLNLNLCDIFKFLSDDNLYIVDLDLSQNYCCSNLPDDFFLPSTVNELTLRNVKWQGDSLSKFLSVQPFRSVIRVDCSYARFDSPPPKDPFSTLVEVPPSTFIESFIWHENPISSKLFRFLSNFSYLHEGVFQSCPILKSDSSTILESMSNFILKTKIAKLAIISTIQNYKDKGIEALKYSLSQNQFLRVLNISNNRIGDRGLMILLDILIQNQNITKVNFSGSDLCDPSLFIQFVRDITQLPSLVHVSKPQKDISFLCSKSSKGYETELNMLWNSLTEATMRNTENNKPDSESNASSVFASQPVDSISTQESFIFTYLEASWEINVEVGYFNFDVEWNCLRKEFDYSTIMNVELPNMDALSNQHQDNLIDFEPV